MSKGHIHFGRYLDDQVRMAGDRFTSSDGVEYEFQSDGSIRRIRSEIVSSNRKSEITNRK